MTEKIATDNRTTLYTTAVENGLDFDSILSMLSDHWEAETAVGQSIIGGHVEKLFKHSILARKYS